MAGYVDYSFSVNYLNAWKRGLRTKSEIKKMVGGLPKNIEFEKIFGDADEWHHTSKCYNITYMWTISDDMIDFIKSHKKVLYGVLVFLKYHDYDSLRDYFESKYDDKPPMWSDNILKDLTNIYKEIDGGTLLTECFFAQEGEGKVKFWNLSGKTAIYNVTEARREQ